MNKSIGLIISSSNLITDKMDDDKKKELESEHIRRERTRTIAESMFTRNEIEPIVLYNSTLDNLEKTIENSFKNCNSYSISYIYINCHGNENGLSMVLDGLSTSSVSYSDLKTMLDKIPGTKVLMIESCHSGASITDPNTSSKVRSLKNDQDSGNAAEVINKSIISTFATPKSNPHLRQGELRADNYQVLAACSATEYSWSYQNGDYFTRYWAAGLGWDSIKSRKIDRLADTNHKGYVTLQDLCDFTKMHTNTREENGIMVTYYQNDMCYPENSDFPAFGTAPISFISTVIGNYYRSHKNIFIHPLGPVMELFPGSGYQNYEGGVIVRYPDGRVEGFTRISYILNRIRQIAPLYEYVGNSTMELYILVSMTQDGRSIVHRERWPKLTVRKHGGTDYNIIYEGDAVDPDHPKNTNVFYSSDVLKGESKIKLTVTVMEYDIPNEDDRISEYNFDFGINNSWGLDGLSWPLKGTRQVNGSQVNYKDIQIDYNDNRIKKWVSLDITVKK